MNLYETKFIILEIYECDKIQSKLNYAFPRCQTHLFNLHLTKQTC